MIWWTKSWNPIVGCTKCSPACDNCYAEALHTQRHNALLAGKKMPDCYRRPFDMPCFVTARINEPLHWRKPQRIFVGNMGDLFHADVADSTLDRIFAVMALCPQHTFMLLTKRPERMREYFARPDITECWEEGAAGLRVEIPNDRTDDFGEYWFSRFPLPNVWLGATIWDQPSADRIVPILLSTPAAKRFMSVEPMLGPVDLGRVQCARSDDPANGIANRQWWNALKGGLWIADIHIEGFEHNLEQFAYSKALDWVICGGETGPGARPMHPDWPRSLRDQCQGAGVPFFFKQWGEWLPGENEPCTLPGHEGKRVAHDQDGYWGGRYGFRLTKRNYVLMENDGRMFFGSALDHPEIGYRDDMAWASRVGTRRAGRLLDGRTWEEVPNA